MEKLKDLWKRIPDTKRQNILTMVFSVTFTVIMLLDSKFFHERLLLLIWIFLGIIIVILISWLFFQAGFTVLKSFFLLSAELSLLIFLAQSYCDVPGRTADNALQALIGVSILYISYEFFKSLKKALTEKLDTISEKKWPWEKVVVVILFVTFSTIFIWIIYQVINPIILNLCVYKYKTII